MRFDTFLPTKQLQPYVRCFAVSENSLEAEYKVLPSTSLVIGFQYTGQLSTITEGAQSRLASAGITGICDSYKIFSTTAGTGTVLVYFTETGFTHFASLPADELFNLSLSLHDLFDKSKIAETEERLCGAQTDGQRIRIVEQFLLSQLKETSTDKLIAEAVKRIHQTKGALRIKELAESLFISQSPFEKRFRKWVGTTPKKFSSIVRFTAALDALSKARSLTAICYENSFFDPAHFSKDFKQFTGESPENFKRLRR